MFDIAGLLQDPKFLMAASGLFQNPADRQAIQGMGQMHLQLQEADQRRKKEEADRELLDLRRQTLQHELGQSQRRAEVGQQLGGLLSEPGFDHSQAIGLMAQLDPMGAARMAGIGATPKQRRIREDPRGIPRYVDSAEPVFPGIGPKPEKPQAQAFEGLSKRGVEGWMQAALARAELKRRQGIPLTQEEEIAVQTAQHSLTQPQIMTAPGGGLLERTPGLPPYAQQNNVPAPGLMGATGSALPPGDPAGAGFLQPPPAAQGGLRAIAPPVHAPSRNEILRADTLERAKGARGVISETKTLGAQARGTLNQLERGMDLLGKVRTGTGANAMLDLKKALAAVGGDVDMAKVANEEELRTILGDQVMATVAKTKGAVSEAEMALFIEYSAASGKTNQGNRQILKFAAEVQRRNIEKANMVNRMQKDGATSIEIQSALDEFMVGNDLSSMLSAPSPAAPAGGQIRFLGFE